VENGWWRQDVKVEILRAQSTRAQDDRLLVRLEWWKVGERGIGSERVKK
jgi:hypothetical protein